MRTGSATRWADHRSRLAGIARGLLTGAHCWCCWCNSNTAELSFPYPVALARCHYFRPSRATESRVGFPHLPLAHCLFPSGSDHQESSCVLKLALPLYRQTRGLIDSHGFVRTPPLLVPRFTLLGAWNPKHCPDQQESPPVLHLTRLIVRREACLLGRLSRGSG